MSGPTTSTATVGGSEPGPDGAVMRRSTLGIVSTVAVAVCLIAVGLFEGRHIWFFADEWNVFGNYPQGELLKPFNGHLSLIPVGIYQVLYATFGVGSHLPFRIAGLAALAVLAFQIARYTRARLGWTAAALAVGAVLWNSAGSSNVLFPFLLNFTIPLAAMYAIWWHMDRGDDSAVEGRSRTRSDVAAAIWLAVALASSALGIMVLIAVVVELALRRAPLRRWLTFSPGVLLWAAWYATNRENSKVSTDPGAVVAYAWRMLLGATTSLAAGWTPGGAVLAAGFVVLLAVAAWRWRTVDARALAALSAPIVFIGVTTVTRLPIIPYIPPDELRYAWTVALYLVAVVIAVWPRRRGSTAGLVADRAVDPDVAIPLARSARTAAVAVTSIVLVVGAVVLVDGMRDWAGMVRSATPGVRAALFAAEAVGADRGDQDVVLPLSYVPVSNGEYLHGVDSVGSPIAGMNPQAFAFPAGRADQVRTADALLVDQLPIGGSAEHPAACPSIAAEASSEPEVIDVPDGSWVLLSPNSSDDLTRLSVLVARFAGPSDGRPVEIDVTNGVGWMHIPADAGELDGASVPYRIVVPAGVSVCVMPDPMPEP